MHDETSEPEDLVRWLGLSSAIARQHGKPLPRDAKTSDVPGHSWILPTLLTHAGITFYHMGGPVVNKAFNLPPLFWWQGPDGSRLLTMYNNSYGTEPLPPKDWPSSNWVYLHMTADNEGPPPPQCRRLRPGVLQAARARRTRADRQNGRLRRPRAGREA